MTRFLHSFCLFFHLTNTDRATRAGQCARCWYTVGTDTVPAFVGLAIYRERAFDSHVHTRCDGYGQGRNWALWTRAQQGAPNDTVGPVSLGSNIGTKK